MTTDANTPEDARLNLTDLLSAFRSPSELRIQWMRLMGIEDSEIADHLVNDPPIDVEQEEAELRAMIAVREMQADRCSSGCRLKRAVKEFSESVSR